MEQFFTYLHCKPNGDPFYVGKGKKKRSHNFHGRILHHRNIVAKYGAENILVYVFPCDSEEQALDDEVRQISCLKLAGYKLVNITSGGRGSAGCFRTKETIEKGKLSRAGYQHSEETKQKMSIAATKWERSEELKQKLSDYAKNRPAEHNEKISKARLGVSTINRGTFKKGHKLSEATKQKMSLSKLGNTAKRDYLNKQKASSF